MAARALITILCNLVLWLALLTHQLSLRAAAPLEGLVSKPVVEDHPPGSGERRRRQIRRRPRHIRRSGSGTAVGFFGGCARSRVVFACAAFACF